MVSKERRRRMAGFVVGRLEDSQRYVIKEVDSSHILVAERPGLVEQPSTIEVLLHSSHQPVREVDLKQRKNLANGTYTAHVFYKDSNPRNPIYFVRLGNRGNKKEDRSLKRYTKTQIDSMIHLRAMEKLVFAQFARYPHLVYYQQSTARLPESLRTFDMQPVYLDYSHIGTDDPAYGRARNGISIDYKIASESDRIVGEPARLQLGQKDTRRALIVRHTLF